MTALHMLLLAALLVLGAHFGHVLGGHNAHEHDAQPQGCMVCALAASSYVAPPVALSAPFAKVSGDMLPRHDAAPALLLFSAFLTRGPPASF